jgi:hypothetical protein
VGGRGVSDAGVRALGEEEAGQIYVS